MQIKTSMTTQEVKDAIADGADFIVFRGKVIGEEDIPHTSDDSEPGEGKSETIVAGMALRKAFEEASLDPNKCDPIYVKANLISKEGDRIPCRIWIDRQEFRKPVEVEKELELVVGPTTASSGAETSGTPKAKSPQAAAPAPVVPPPAKPITPTPPTA
jgi:hypothetical protein